MTRTSWRGSSKNTLLLDELIRFIGTYRLSHRPIPWELPTKMFNFKQQSENANGWEGFDFSQLEARILAIGGATKTHPDGSVEYISPTSLYGASSDLVITVEVPSLGPMHTATKQILNKGLEKDLFNLVVGTEITWPTYEFRGFKLKGEKPKHDMYRYLSTYGCCVLEFVRDTNIIHSVRQPTLGARLAYLLDLHAAT